MCIDDKSARCWKFLPEDTRTQFPPGSTFQLNWRHCLILMNTLCTRFERSLEILKENRKNHHIRLLNERIGFSLLDVFDRFEPKFQIRSPYELTNAIISTDEGYKDCFLWRLAVPAQSNNQFLQIIYQTEDSILQQPQSTGHCISADARMNKGFDDLLS